MTHAAGSQPDLSKEYNTTAMFWKTQWEKGEGNQLHFPAMTERIGW